MKKALLALSATAAASAALISPAPAAASCSEIVEELGCIENVVCGAAAKVIAKTPLGREIHCIQ